MGKLVVTRLRIEKGVRAERKWTTKSLVSLRNIDSSLNGKNESVQVVLAF